MWGFSNKDFIYNVFRNQLTKLKLRKKKNDMPLKGNFIPFFKDNIQVVTTKTLTLIAKFNHAL